jgi:thioredoxin 1
MTGSANVTQATDTNFDSEVLKSAQLTLVDFWAEWCGPCKALGPTIEALATEFAGRVKVCKMNVDENPKTPGGYRIKGIPTVLFFRGGQLVDQLVGNQPKEALVQTIQRHLG